jgi:hypothetical protein
MDLLVEHLPANQLFADHIVELSCDDELNGGNNR